MNLRLHDEFTVSVRAESVKEALEIPLPSPDKPHEQTEYLRSVHNVLTTVLSGDIRANPYFFGPDNAGQPGLRKLRGDLTTLIHKHGELLGNTHSGARVPGWNRLMMCWIIIAQLFVCLHRLRSENESPQDLDSTSLYRNELVTTGGGILDVLVMSMAELRQALHVFRARLCMLDTVDAAIFRYALLLELRAAQFVCNDAVRDDDFDVEVWTESPVKQANREFVVCMTWWFFWIKRYILTYVKLSAPSFFSTARLPGRVLRIVDTTTPAGLTPQRTAVTNVLAEYAKFMKTRDHQRDFSKIALQYSVAPGDLDTDTQLFGMNGLEKSTIPDVLSRNRTPTGATYAVSKKYRRPLREWLNSFLDRVELVGRGRFVGGGASCEAFLEQIAIIHIFHMFIVSKTKIPFINWFVVTSRGAGGEFEKNVTRALPLGYPFIIQRLGRFACCVPTLPGDLTHAAVEERLGMFERGEHDSPRRKEAAVLYDANDCIDAIVLWCGFMLYAWNGNIKHSNIQLAPLLKSVLESAPQSGTASSASRYKV